MRSLATHGCWSKIPLDSFEHTIKLMSFVAITAPLYSIATGDIMIPKSRQRITNLKQTTSILKVERTVHFDRIVGQYLMHSMMLNASQLPS